MFRVINRIRFTHFYFQFLQHDSDLLYAYSILLLLNAIYLTSILLVTIIILSLKTISLSSIL